MSPAGDGEDGCRTPSGAGVGKKILGVLLEWSLYTGSLQGLCLVPVLSSKASAYPCLPQCARASVLSTELGLKC